MKEQVLVLACAVGAALVVAGLAITVNAGTKAHIERLERTLEYHKAKHDYYFQGANNRGYLDICRKGDEVAAIVFKDECEEER